MKDKVSSTKSYSCAASLPEPLLPDSSTPHHAPRTTLLRGQGRVSRIGAFSRGIPFAEFQSTLTNRESEVLPPSSSSSHPPCSHDLLAIQGRQRVCIGSRCSRGVKYAGIHRRQQGVLPCTASSPSRSPLFKTPPRIMRYRSIQTGSAWAVMEGTRHWTFRFFQIAANTPRLPGSSTTPIAIPSIRQLPSDYRIRERP